MKKNIIFGSIYAILLAFSLFSPEASFAASYVPGTLLRDPDTKTVYYIASNGKRYAIPNEATLQTWYPGGIANIEYVPEKRTIHRIGSGKASVTVRPGNALVLF